MPFGYAGDLCGRFAADAGPAVRFTNGSASKGMPIFVAPGGAHRNSTGEFTTDGGETRSVHVPAPEDTPRDVHPRRIPQLPDADGKRISPLHACRCEPYYANNISVAAEGGEALETALPMDYQARC